MSGSMTWTLIANADRYAAGMNKAAASTKAAARQQEQMSRQTRLLRGAVAAVSAAAIIKFGSDSVKAFKEAEVAQAKLTQAYAKFPKLADVNIGAMRAMNSELQKVTVYEDDATAAMQARLAMYDLTGQQLRELTPLVMDYASATGQDLASAGDAIGKALLGNTRALKSVGISYKATGDRAKDYAAIQSMLSEKVGGFAEAEGKTAAGQAARLANAYGDLQESVGEALLPALEAVVDVLTPLTESFNELPKGAKTAAVVIGAVGTAALIATPRILALRSALATTGAAGAGAAAGTSKFAKGLKGVGIGAAAAAVGLPVISSIVDSIGDKMFGTTTAAEDLSYQLSTMGNDGNVGRFGAEFRTFGEELANLTSPSMGQRVEDFFGTLAGNGGGEGRQRVLDEIGAIDGALTDLVNSGKADEAARQVTALMANAAAWGVSTSDVSALLPGYNSALAGTASSFTAVGGAADDAEDDVKTFREELTALNAPTRDLTQSQIGVVKSAADLAKGMRENGKAFGLSTEAGQANLENLLDLTSKIEEYGAAVEAKTGSTEKARAAMVRERDALVKNLVKMGIARDRAQELVDKYLKMPAATKAAADGVDKVTDAINRIPSNKTVTITVQTNGQNRRLIAAETLASGGLVTGPGSGTSDDVAAWLSNGEYVLTAATTRRIGVANLDRLNRGTGMASGGLVDAGFAGSGGGSSSGSSRRRRRSSGSSGGGPSQLTQDRASMRDSIRFGNSPLDSFDFGAYASAVDDAKQATQDLADAKSAVLDADTAIADARRAMNRAGTPEEQARAAEQLAEAEKRRTDALRDQARAQIDLRKAERQKRDTKLTGANIASSFKDRARKLDRFRRDLMTLKKRGLAPGILKEILDAGLDEGGAMARALVTDGNIADLNQTWRNITADSAALARAFTPNPGGGSSGGTGGGGTTGSTGSGAGIAISLENATRPIVLKMDSEQVWRGLVKLKKSKGGVSLGLS